MGFHDIIRRIADKFNILKYSVVKYLFNFLNAQHDELQDVIKCLKVHYEIN